MSAIIEVTNGRYRIRGRDQSVAGMRFTLVEPWRADRGYFIVAGGSVDPRNAGIPDRSIRIRTTEPESYTLVSGTPDSRPRPIAGLETNRVDDQTVAHFTDAELIDKTRTRFEVLSNMTAAVRAGQVRALIVSGPPGVGKSWGVNHVLSRDDVFDVLAARKPKYEIVKGAMSALGLYAKLWEYANEECVVVFDDCDSVLLDDLSLNILKGALDSCDRRWIAWNTDSRLLKGEGIPSRFEFKGGVIFITNLKFEHIRSKKLQDHLVALESRCHYIDLLMDTDREKMLRIRQIVADGMLAQYEFTDDEINEVVEFVNDNKASLRELSLRSVLKVADLRKSFPQHWESMAAVTVLRRGGQQ